MLLAEGLPAEEQEEEAVPSLSERRTDAWTALAAEPAVRAAERALVTESGAVLHDTLSIAVGAAVRRRLARVLDLKDRAAANPERREAYQRAADDLRNWAAGVYLAALRDSESMTQPETSGPRGRRPKPVVKHRNPHTEESISLRRNGPRPPFPGQRKRRPGDRVPVDVAARSDERRSRHGSKRIDGSSSSRKRHSVHRASPARSPEGAACLGSRAMAT